LAYADKNTKPFLDVPVGHDEKHRQHLIHVWLGRPAQKNPSSEQQLSPSPEQIPLKLSKML